MEGDRVVKVLVTGDKGFVGRHTVPVLRAAGHEVEGFDAADGLDLREGLFDAAERVDVVLHLAAVAQFAAADENPIQALEVNALGTRNVVRACEAFSLPLVHASTGSVYMPVLDVPIREDHRLSGNSVYGVTKRIAEAYVEEAKVPAVILRYAHLYGPGKIGHGLVGGVLGRIAIGEPPLVMGDGNQTNDFTYISDIAAANLAAVERVYLYPGVRAYNIGTGVELSAMDAARIVAERAGWTGPIEHAPRREVDASRFAFDVSAAERDLGWKALVPFWKGMETMLKEIEWASK
jgi:UDP-glucose 4-epimerase